MSCFTIPMAFWGRRATLEVFNEIDPRPLGFEFSKLVFCINSSIDDYLNLDIAQCVLSPILPAAMDPRFLPHNSHLDDVRRFADNDPQMRHLAGCPYRHRSSLLDSLPTSAPGIYSLGGGRQTGKSTLLKQWMAELMGSGAPPESIAYFSGELIDDHHSLLLHLEEQLAAAPDTGLNYLIVDEER